MPLLILLLLMPLFKATAEFNCLSFIVQSKGKISHKEHKDRTKDTKRMKQAQFFNFFTPFVSFVPFFVFFV